MTKSHWLNIFKSWSADLCEKKIPLRRKWWGVCPETFSILSTSSSSTLLLPNLTKERHDTMWIYAAVVCLKLHVALKLPPWLEIYHWHTYFKIKKTLAIELDRLKASLEAHLNLTYEFVVIHSLGVGGGNVPWVNCVFIISAICCWPVVRGSRVFWGRTACFVILTCHLFVVHFQL